MKRVKISAIYVLIRAGFLISLGHFAPAQSAPALYSLTGQQAGGNISGEVTIDPDNNATAIIQSGSLVERVYFPGIYDSSNEANPNNRRYIFIGVIESIDWDVDLIPQLIDFNLFTSHCSGFMPNFALCNGVGTQWVSLVPSNSDDGDASYSISGDRYVGKTLSASRDNDDPDGNGSITGYTWQTSIDGSTWSTVGTDSTYTLTGSEEGKYLRLTVAYTDGESFSESVTTSNVQAKDFTTAMAKPFAALKSNNLEIVNSYVKNSLLSSQQSCATQGVEIFDGKACIHGNYSYASRYTFGDSGNNSFQAHQTAGNYGFDYQVTNSLNIGLRYGRGNSTMDNDTNTTGTSSQASVDTNHWGLKATYEGKKNLFLSGYLGFTDFDVDLDRQSTTNDGTTTSANSSFDGDAYSAGIKIAKVIPIKSNAVLVPELSATYSTYEQPQIIETGSGDLLTVDRTDSQSLLLRIGGKAVKSLKTNQGRYDASVYLGAWYEVDPYSTRNGQHRVSAQFTESSAAAVSSKSQSVKDQKVNFEAGGAVQLSDQVQLTLSGGLDLAADVSNSYVRGGMTWAF